MPDSVARGPDFAAVYRAHHDFVWRTLQHLGVDRARVDDATQDVFLVVHRRLAQFTNRAAVRTWLFEIARRIASRYRRTVAREVRREALAAELAATAGSGLEQAEARAIVARLLAELGPDQALVFVLAEFEQWRAPEIAEELGINVNTVYSRLRAARRELDRLLRRIDARERRFGSSAAVLACLGYAGTRAPGLAPIGASPVSQSLANRTWAIGQVGQSGAVGGAGFKGLAVLGVSLVAAVAIAAAPTAGRPETPAAAATVAEAPDTRAAGRVEAGPVEAVAPVEAGQVEARPEAPPKVRRKAGEDPLTAELALVESIRAAVLAQDDRAVIDGVARHQRRFREGVFAQEVAAAAIEARCRLGERARARGEAEEFVEKWPDSNLAARVASLCGG